MGQLQDPSDGLLSLQKCFFFLRDSQGRFTRYDFVAYDKLTTRLRHELLRVNQTYNSLNGPKSCRRPVVSLSYATKSYRVNRPLHNEFLEKKKKLGMVLVQILIKKKLSFRLKELRNFSLNSRIENKGPRSCQKCRGRQYFYKVRKTRHYASICKLDATRNLFLF